MNDLVVASAHARIHRAQSADILLGRYRDELAALRWIAAVFDDFPGCRIAAAAHRAGGRCVLGLRTSAWLITARTSVPGAEVLSEVLARRLFTWSSTRRGRDDTEHREFLQHARHADPSLRDVALTADTRLVRGPQVVLPCAR